MSEEDVLKIIVFPDREPSPYSGKPLADFAISSNNTIPLDEKMYQFGVRVHDSLRSVLKRSTKSRKSEETNIIWDNFRDWFNVNSRLMQSLCSYETRRKHNEWLNANATPL